MKVSSAATVAVHAQQYVLTLSALPGRPAKGDYAAKLAVPLRQSVCAKNCLKSLG